jgi:hypothetical protein
MKMTTPTELAEELETDPRTVRKFLRSLTPKEKQPGRGHRWEIPANKRSLTRLSKQFEAWAALHTRTNGEGA